MPDDARRRPPTTTPSLHVRTFPPPLILAVASVQDGQLNLRHARKFTLRNASGMTKGSALTEQPLTLVFPVSADHLKPAISNRNFSRLEIPATPTKQTVGAKSNRNFRSTNSDASHALPGVRTVAHPTHNRAYTQRRPGTASPCPQPSSSPSVKCSTPLTLSSHKTQISNRHRMRLEIAVTHRKQTVGISSNRHKNTTTTSQKSALVSQLSAVVGESR
jgi:hypothetical protein